MATYTTTLAATYTSALTDIENINGWNRKFVIPYTYLAQASATTATDVVTVALGNTPANWVVNRARVVVTTALNISGTQTCTIQVGTTSSIAAFVSAQSILTVASLGQASTIGQLTNATGTSSLGLLATFTNAAAGSLSATTAFSCTILLDVQDVSASIYQPNQ